MNKYFLWNELSFSDITLTEDSSFIENFFSQVFYPFKVIYLSRARHFIPLVLNINNLKRKNIIFTQPYSSHCVLSSISLQSSPSTVNGNFVDASIIYHQYGYKTLIKEKDKYNNILIEDSVDSIFLDKSKEELFPNDGIINIISLPKIMKIPFGAIAICKNQELYEKLKSHIELNVRKGFFEDVFYQKVFKNNFFKEIILEQFKLLSPKITDIDDLYYSSIDIVKDNINLIKNYYLIKDDFSKRLPSNIMVEKTIVDSEIMKLIKEPFRHIYNYNTGIIVEKHLIPVHCGINWKNYI